MRVAHPRLEGSGPFAANTSTYELAGTTLTLHLIVSKEPCDQAARTFARLQVKLEATRCHSHPSRTPVGNRRRFTMSKRTVSVRQAERRDREEPRPSVVAGRRFRDIDAFCRRHVLTKPKALDAGLVTYEPARTGRTSTHMRSAI